MDYNQLIADCSFAFGSGQFENALEMAQKAIEVEPNKFEGYNWAGKACISLGRPEEAVGYFKKVVSFSNMNGNAFFMLGYAQAYANQLSDALRSFSKALELNCDNVLRGQIYKMIAMVNASQGDYQNAIKNYEQAEEIANLDYEIIEQKAACYASLKDYHNAISTINQIKLLRPSDYKAYSMATNIFFEVGLFDEAKAELDRAKKFADLSMDYYLDLLNYTLLKNPDNESQEYLTEKLNASIALIDEALAKGKPTAAQVYDLYMRAAQVYLSLDNPQQTIRILDAAVNPISTFNNGFSVSLDSQSDVEDAVTPTEMLSPEAEEAVMQERWDNGELDEFRDAVETALMQSTAEEAEDVADEVALYLTPPEVLPANEEDSQPYSLSGEFSFTQEQKDMRNAIYLSAYERLQDYDNMFQKARELQSSSILANQYSGMYYELKVSKYTNQENWQRKYKDRINYWTKRIIEDPLDFVSASYRIRSYIDLGDFAKAEQLCSDLPAEAKKTLMEEIDKAKSEGGGGNGNINQ